MNKPLAYMRRWAFDGIDVMKLPKAERPKGWQFHAVTVNQVHSTDVPLYAGEPEVIDGFANGPLPRFDADCKGA